MSDTSSSQYAGDLGPGEAWSLLAQDRSAQLVDVRTSAEWNFVGVPDLQSLGRGLHCIEWQSLPAFAANRSFTEAATASLKSAGAHNDTPILFICRSGARSRAAAIAVTNAGFRCAYNISSGFEGDLDGESHRGRRNGWKAEGLPWRQT